MIFFEAPPFRPHWPAAGFALLLLAACHGGGAEASMEETASDAGGLASHQHTHSHANPTAYPSDGGLADAALDAPDAAMQADGGFAWPVPSGFPVPKVPEDNAMSDSKVELGRHLFYDKRLSGNETQACASCHLQALAFTDGRPIAIGSTGELHPRASMTLVNVGYISSLTWANPVLPDLERQALVPLFGEEPVELGMVGLEEELVARLQAEPMYPQRFANAFPEYDGEISLSTITKSLAAFERSIISVDSPYDRYQRGDSGALSDEQQRGMALFFSERMECFHCHGGFNFSDSTTFVGKAFDEVAFHNTGLYNLDEYGSYPEDNLGLYNFTSDRSDLGRFKAPTLRNVALTGPYMHDGSIETLEEVIDHYAAGGRTIEEGPYAGVGSLNPNKSEFVTGFDVTPEEKSDLVNFLQGLTDDSLLTNPRYSDPWTGK